MSLDALVPVMPADCVACVNWFELNDMDACMACSPRVMCRRCYREHMADHEAEDDLYEEDR
ncbi:hypothetical protein AB0383_20275 [Amycolatopsis sp. NPDC051373]|uniref:hypothetical protein n=1 Tax=Amycolatopsis sp. NPDC051373 TaxID=3155801 RepID=UPI00344D6CF6